ncbi:MAG: hypothetical protein LAT64_09415 [Phycisphaerales bacterium]|nr:hypothetical protein [Planctomycetota bacterium]MCH8508967.1 hypothetical protein [Phycisphaerales bacterium]
MSEQARVHDTEALRRFRPALIRFAEDANTALVSEGSGAMKILETLRRDRLPHWKREIRLRSELAVRANTKLIQQTAGKDARPSVDARKAYEAAKRAVKEAEDKHAHTQRHIRQLEKAIETYRTAVQPMATVVRARIPAAVATLDKAIAALDAYAAAERKPEDDRPAAPNDAPSIDPPGEGTDQ